MNKQVNQLSVQASERLFLSIAKANRDVSKVFVGVEIATHNDHSQEKVFPDPTKIDITRPANLYITGDGITRAFGNEFVHSVSVLCFNRGQSLLFCLKVMGSVLKSIFALPNLRRAPGISGQLKR